MQIRNFIFFFFACNCYFCINCSAQVNLLQSAFSNTGIAMPLPLVNNIAADNMYLWCKWYTSQNSSRKDDMQSNTMQTLYNRTIEKICRLQLQEMPLANNEILPDVLQHKLFFQQANTLFKQKKYSEAIAFYKKVPTSYLTNLQIVEKNFNLAYCYLTTNQEQEVAPLMASVVDIKGNYFQSGNYYYGLLQFYNGDYPEALKSFERIQNDKEYKKVVPYYISSIYYYNKSKEEALVKALTYLNDEKANIYFRDELNLLVGQIYFDNKIFDKAIPYLEEYLADASSIRREDLFLLGFSHYQVGNIDKAQAMLSRVSEDLDTVSQMTNYVLGDCYLKKANKEEARESFQKVLNIDGIISINEISRFHFASLSYEMGIDDDALNGAYNLVQKFPESTYRDDCIKMIGNILMNTKNYKAALQIMREFSNAPEIRKAHQKIAFNQAMQEIKNKDYVYAMALLKESDSNMVSAEIANQSDFWKGEIAYLQKNYTAALQYVNMFITKNKKPKADINVSNAYLLKTYIGIKTGNDSLAIASLNNIYKNKNDAYLLNNAVELNNINRLLDSFIAVEAKNNEYIKSIAALLDKPGTIMGVQMAKLDSLTNIKPYQAQRILHEKAIWQMQKGELLESMQSLQTLNVKNDARLHYYTIQNAMLQKNEIAIKDAKTKAMQMMDTNNEWQAKSIVLFFDNAIENKDSNSAKEYLAMLARYQNLNYAKVRIPIKEKLLKNLQTGIVNNKSSITNVTDTTTAKKIVKQIATIPKTIEKNDTQKKIIDKKNINNKDNNKKRIDKISEKTLSVVASQKDIKNSKETIIAEKKKAVSTTTTKNGMDSNLKKKENKNAQNTLTKNKKK